MIFINKKKEEGINDKKLVPCQTSNICKVDGTKINTYSRCLRIRFHPKSVTTPRCTLRSIKFSS